jgi:23S rRNA pseudouridine2605 synthase
MMERLHKRLAHAGVASRRKAELLIREGRVKVDGVVITQMGTLVAPTQEVHVDDQKIDLESKVYFLLNKPTKTLSSVTDDRQRRTVVDLIDTPIRIYPVGRLDFTTTGALILTNDGDLAHALMHPSFHVEKTYICTIEGQISSNQLKALRTGIRLEDGTLTLPARVDEVELLANQNKSIVHLTLQEGRYHQVKRMMEALQHKVLKLHRSHYAFLDVHDLMAGQYRPLKPFEVKKLRQLAQFGKQR